MMDLESQTQLGDIPRPLKGSAGVFLDSTQPVAHGVRVAIKYLGRAAHRRIVVLPHPKRFEKHLPVLVGKIGKTLQHSADRFDHRLRRADRGGGQDGAVDARTEEVGRSGRATSLLPRAGLVAYRADPEGRTDAHPHRGHPRHEGNNPVECVAGRDVHDADLQMRQPPPRRKDVQAAQLRLDLGSGSSPAMGTWAATTTNGP